MGTILKWSTSVSKNELAPREREREIGHYILFEIPHSSRMKK